MGGGEVGWDRSLGTSVDARTVDWLVDYKVQRHHYKVKPWVDLFETRSGILSEEFTRGAFEAPTSFSMQWRLAQQLVLRKQVATTTQAYNLRSSPA